MPERAVFDMLSTRLPDGRGRKLSEVVAHRIVDIITRNKLSDGTRLPVEAELQARLGVGKNTLREAFRILEGWGVIELKQGRYGGPVVRAPQPEDLRDALAVQLQFASATLVDVFEARCCVEPQSVVIATTRMSDDEIASLRESVRRMRAEADDLEVFLEENGRFHTDIATGTRNVVFQALTGTLRSVLDGTIEGVEYVVGVRLAVADAHGRIVAAMEERNPDAARQAMYDHLHEAGVHWAERSALVGRDQTWAF